MADGFPQIIAQAPTSEGLVSESLAPVVNEAAAHANQLSIIELIADASITVQLVMLVLLLASLVSWKIIYSKRQMLAKERKLTAKFEREFWDGGSMQALYNEWGADNKNASGMSEIFVAGFREFERLSERGYANNNDLLDAVQRAMRVELSREIDHLESQIPFLATVGSTSPYIGLFGTVWGLSLIHI